MNLAELNSPGNSPIVAAGAAVGKNCRLARRVRASAMHSTTHSKISSLRRAALLFTLGALGLAGCGQQNANDNSGSASSGGTASSGEKRLGIVSPHSVAIQAEFERLFKAKHPDVSFQWFDNGGTSELLRMVQGQTKAQGNTKFDLFFGGGTETFIELENNDLLQPLSSDYSVPAELNGVPLRGENNRWVAAALSGFGILVNQTFAKRDNLPIPTVWGDLANPKLMDRVELADPRRSGSAHTTYEIILQTNGWEQGWKVLLGMAANARAFKPSASDLITDVTSGEAVFVTAIDFYGRRAVAAAGGNKLLYVEPKGQTVVTPDPIGLLKGAPHADLAKEFIDLVMSPEGQKIWILKKGVPGGPKMDLHADDAGFFRLAALPSVYEPIPKDSLIQSNPFKFKNERPYDAGKGAKRRQALDALMGVVLIDNRALLKAAYKKNPNLSYVPISEADLDKAAAQWDNNAFRIKTTAQWRQEASKKFQ